MEECILGREKFATSLPPCSGADLSSLDAFCKVASSMNLDEFMVLGTLTLLGGEKGNVVKVGPVFSPEKLMGLMLRI